MVGFQVFISVVGGSPEVLSSFTTLMLQFLRQFRHEAAEMSEFQSFPQIFFWTGVKRVEVHPQGPRKQHGVLQTKGPRSIQSFISVVRSCRPSNALSCRVWSCDLRDDGDSGPEVMEADMSHVDSIDNDSSARRLQDPEDSQSQRRLPGSCSSNDPDLTNPKQS